MKLLRQSLLPLFLILIGLAAGVAATSTFGLLPSGQAVNSAAGNNNGNNNENNTGNNTMITPPMSGQIFAEVSKKVTPAVVNIATARQAKGEEAPSSSPFDDPFFKRFFREEPSRRPKMPHGKERGLGSGVIVDPNGYIITNNHVVAQANEITVVLDDRREFKGKVVGSDPKSDLALVKIEASGLPTIPWGSSARLQTGEYVLAVGNPFGLNQTVTMGIISAIGRADVGIADYEDFIQTDAAINPGNSGGALVNIKGELIGINTAIFSQSGGYMGIGFAVPSDMVRSVADSLEKNGKVSRGWLGISIQEVTPELAREFGLPEPKGALIGDVQPGSPAEKAGLKRGDVILALNGKEIKTTGQLRNQVAATSVGSKIKIKIFRDKHEKEIEATLNEQSNEVARNGSPEKEERLTALTGVAVADLNPETAREMSISNRNGVVVQEVDPDSRAQEAGLRRGDVILEVNRAPVKNIEEYTRKVSNLKKEEGALLLVSRHGRTLFLSVGAA